MARRSIQTPGVKTTDPVVDEQEPNLKQAISVHRGQIIPLESTPYWAVTILENQKRIEDKLDTLAEQAGVKVNKPPRFKFHPDKGHVME